MHVIADIIVIDVYVTMQEFIVTELRVYSTALIHLTCDWTHKTSDLNKPRSVFLSGRNIFMVKTYTNGQGYIITHGLMHEAQKLAYTKEAQS